MLGYKKSRASGFQFISGSLAVHVPAVGKRSCRSQWPKQAHKQAQPCSSLLHCLQKRRVIRVRSAFRNRPNTHGTQACSNCPWKWVSQHLDPVCSSLQMWACVWGGCVICGSPAITLVWAKTTFSVMPPSLSSSFSPMQAMTPRPFSRAWAVFWPISYRHENIKQNVNHDRNYAQST